MALYITNFKEVKYRSLYYQQSSKKIFQQYVESQQKGITVPETYHNIRISQTFINDKRSCSLVAKWPLLINAKIFDKPDLKISSDSLDNGQHCKI